MQIFHASILDKDPVLLQESYNLRYQVYCLERGFLPQADYPQHCEVDQFDATSLHIGALNGYDELVGTVRLVHSSPVGFPMYKVCEIFPEVAQRLSGMSKLAEVSRLSISKHDRRHQGDCGARPGTGGERRVGERRVGERHDNPSLIVSLYKAIYQTSKQAGITHLLAAMEKSLLRLLLRYKFPFHAIGPEVDYFGPVTPYLLDLAELEQKLLQHHSPLLEECQDGLEMQFWPTLPHHFSCGADRHEHNRF